MRVLFLNPPAPDGERFMREGRCTQRSSFWATLWPPVTLAYGSSIARAAGHDAHLIDAPAAFLGVRAVEDELRRLPTDLCVVATSTPSFAGDMAVIARLKSASPRTRFATIGVHVSTRDESVLRENPAVDFVIRGETEETFGFLLNALDSGGSPRDIDGLTWRDDSKIVRNHDRAPIGDLDALPFPDWSAAGLDNYRLPFSRRRFLCLAPHRGCPYSCTFCTAPVHYGHKVRKRSIDNVIREIRRNHDEYGVDDLFMWADTFTIDRAFVMELCGAMKTHTPDTRWTCNSRLDTVDEDMLAQMAGAGCWMMSFGIESHDPVVLHSVKKEPRVRDRTELYAPIAKARRLGIRTVAHFILGLPGDTPDTIRRVISIARSLPLDFAQFYAAAPFVGSPLHEQAVRNGWLREGTAFARMDQSHPSLELPGLPAREVERVRRMAVWRFYFSPARAFRVARLAGFGLVREFGALLSRRRPSFRRPGVVVE